MSANIELALLTRVIKDRDFQTLDKLQITEDYFFTEEGKQVYRHLRETFHNPTTLGQVPSIDMLRYRIPSFYEAPCPDTVPVLTSELRREKMRVELHILRQTLEQMIDVDPHKAAAELRSKAQSISTIDKVGEDVSLSSAVTMLRQNYDMVSQQKGLLGIPFPWTPVNEETQGMQDSQFILLYGRPKSMKSWTGIAICEHAYTYARKKVLIYTKEMPVKLMCMRLAATLCKVDYRAFKNGSLPPDVSARVWATMEGLADDEKSLDVFGNGGAWIRVISDRGQKGGVAWLQSKIREYKPDMAMVDGLYLMGDDRSGKRDVDWKSIAHISQDMKLTANEMGIPILGVTQASRKGDKDGGSDLTDIAYSDALGQDTDAAFHVTLKKRVDEQGNKSSEIELRVPGGREFEFDGIIIHGKPATDFSYVRMLTTEDSEEEKKATTTYGGGGQQPEYRGKPESAFKDPRIPVPR